MTRKCESCTTLAVFNYSNQKVGRYCSEHKLPGMVNVVSKTCEHKDCNTRPSFNYPSEKTGLYCVEHKLPDMVNVKDKKCAHDSCNKCPIFNYPDENGGRYCSEHKLPNMVDVKNKKCEHDSCTKYPIFNYPDKKVRRYCSEHKLPGMINVVNKRCEHESCTKHPIFNYPDENGGRYCSDHKLHDMVNVVNKKCEHENCNTRPNFNYSDKKIGLYCFDHKLSDMVDVKHKTCLSETCDIRPSNEKYKGYCLMCFVNLFPNEKVSRNYKIQEQHVKEFILREFSSYNPIFDKSITGGCSKKRPDCFIDLLTHVLIIECDENQHDNYTEICENKRTMGLFQDCANRPMVFIRFNPDAYTVNGKKNPSSFKMHQTSSVPIIRKESEWKYRLNALRESMEYYLNNIPEKELIIEQLFFDD